MFLHIALSGKLDHSVIATSNSNNGLYGSASHLHSWSSRCAQGPHDVHAVGLNVAVAE